METLLCCSCFLLPKLSFQVSPFFSAVMGQGQSATDGLNNLANAIRGLGQTIQTEGRQQPVPPAPPPPAGPPAQQQWHETPPFPSMPPGPCQEAPSGSWDLPQQPTGTRYLRVCNFCKESAYWREGVCLNERCRESWLHLEEA